MATEPIVLTISVGLSAGGMGSRTWPITQEQADTVAELLGEPLVEAVLNEDELRASNDLLDSTEMPAMWSDDGA